MAKKHEVVAQFGWTAVVKVIVPPGFRYDIKEWDLYRLRWGNMSQAKGFGDLAVVSRIAEERSNVIDAMIRANRNLPPVL
ncbi:hypothetical protein EON82_25680 [bacterium]|nr:MAG: hypothetical protein EON82_25680 [bacterium]